MCYDMEERSNTDILPKVELMTSFLCLALVGSFLIMHPKFNRDLYPLIGISCLAEAAYYFFRIIGFYPCYLKFPDLWIQTYVNLFNPDANKLEIDN